MKRRFLSLLLAFTMLAALAPLALAAEDEWLVETKTYEDLDGTEETTYTYDFDSNGHIITYYSESSSGHWDQHTYTYDSTGNKLSEYYESSSVYWYQRTYTYDSTGNMLNQYYENSRGTAYYPRIYTYDNAGNMLTDYYNSSSGYWWKHTYTYDSTGNVLTEYYEDSDGYLEKYTYTYDSNGNMLSEYYEYYEEDSDGYWYKCTYTYILKSSLVLPEQSFTATNDGAVTNGGEKERTVDVIIVSYDDNGYLLDVSSETVKFDAGETIDYDLAENERIFVWNSLKGMYPLTAE